MANGNGSKLVFSKETLVPVSLLLLAVTLVANLAMSWQEKTSTIEQLEADHSGFEKRLDDQQESMAKYRAQVDAYRTEDYRQTETINKLRERTAALERTP